MTIWKEISDHIAIRSTEICKDNGCTEDEHKCESYAYIVIDSNGQPILRDVCCRDYWQGDCQSTAAIPLPWNGTPAELKEEVLEQTYDDWIKTVKI